MLNIEDFLWMEVEYFIKNNITWIDKETLNNAKKWQQRLNIDLLTLEDHLHLMLDLKIAYPKDDNWDSW